VKLTERWKMDPPETGAELTWTVVAQSEVPALAAWLKVFQYSIPFLHTYRAHCGNNKQERQQYLTLKSAA
jgi:hypothetical protein